MTKFDTIHDRNVSSTPSRKKGNSRGFYVLGVLIISLIAFAPAVDAGCSCSVGNWDPSGFLNSEMETGQPVQTGVAQSNAPGNSETDGDAEFWYEHRKANRPGGLFS